MYISQKTQGKQTNSFDIYNYDINAFSLSRLVSFKFDIQIKYLGKESERFPHLKSCPGI